MKTRKILLYIPMSRSTVGQGGQVIAAEGLVNYIRKQGIDYSVINTAPNKNGRFRLLNKIQDLIERISLFFKLSSNQEFSAVLFFNSGFFSLLERSVLSFWIRKNKIKTALFFRNSNFEGYISNVIGRQILKSLLTCFDCHFVQGESLRRKLTSNLAPEGSISVIPNWIQPKFNCVLKNLDSKKLINENIKFIFTGRFTKEKGVFTLLNAFQAVLRNGYDCHLTLVGDGPELNEMIKLIDRLCLIKNVKIVSWQSQEALIELLLNHDVFVFPTNHPEGMPNSLIEAMAVGLPAIATNVGAIKDIVESNVNGYIVDKSVDSVANKMIYYCRNREVISLHGDNAKSAVYNNHNYEKNCKSLIDILLS